MMRIWSHLLKKFLIENFIFCAVIHKRSPQPILGQRTHHIETS